MNATNDGFITDSMMQNIDANEINKAVQVLKDYLKIRSGSVGDFDLYTVLRAYITKPECRAGINELSAKALYD